LGCGLKESAMSYELKSTFATLPRTARGVSLVLGGDPKGKNFLYTNGTSVIIRDIANPSIAEIYTEHSVQTTVAKYSPSGFYIASADVSGKVRIWDTTQKEHILKNEFQPLGGQVKDLAWSGDSQRIVVVGEGREKFGHVFSADTGASVGEIMGQSKALNSVDFRADRPMRIVTAGEDNTLAFFHGPPFKFQFTIQDHTRFVNSVRYAPNGDFFVSGGADGKSFIYDGKTGEKRAEIGNPAHKGGIYGVCVSPDSRQILTVSGDKTAKIWDVATTSVVQDFVMGDSVEDMQVSCLWQGEHILTVSLAGFINYLDKNSGRPSRILKGHNKPITALSATVDRKEIYTASSDGNVCRWNVATGENDMVPGKGHSNQVQDMVVTDSNLVTCGMDDMIMFTKLSTVAQSGYQHQIKLPSLPKGVDSAGALTVAACVNEVVVLRDGHIVCSQKVTYEPQCVAISPSQSDIAVGGADNKIHVYSVTGNMLHDKLQLSHNGALTSLKYSPDGTMLAAGDTYRKVLLYQLPDYSPLVTTEWGYHTARVNCVAWTSDCKHVATGALDTNIIVWSPASKTNYTVVKGAHPMSQVTCIEWLDNETLVSTGHDSCVKQWRFKL
jgi:WD40 repeat protein